MGVSLAIDRLRGQWVAGAKHTSAELQREMGCGTAKLDARLVSVEIGQPTEGERKKLAGEHGG